MKKLNGYMAGANLGHWISQYGNAGEEHFDSYIQKPDIERMKSWGLDHVRLPVDYFFFEDDENPGIYDESRLAYIDRTLEWCAEYGMNMIIDLHHAPGFFFNSGDRNDLFTNEKSSGRFMKIWEMFASRYKSYGESLIFELLNELVWKDSGPWNRHWQETAERIWKISPSRRIIIGSNSYNSVNQMKNLHVTGEGEDRIIYTFHFYEPFHFTHQHAPWIHDFSIYPKQISYPFRPEDHIKLFGGSVPDAYKKYPEVGRKYLENFIQPALDFQKLTGKTVYCGEYGVISYADTESAVRWLNDIADIMCENQIGRAVWSYRGFSAITFPGNDGFNQDMADAVSRR